MERAQIIVPTSGVRKDVAELIQTPDMMRNGVNVMVYDGTVRPRPGSNRVDIGGVVTTWKSIAYGINCWAAFGANLLIQDAEGDWFYSIDHGFEWFSLPTEVTGPTTVVRLAYCRDSGVLLAFDGDGDLWSADVSSFPTPKDVTFTNIGSYLSAYGTPARLHATDPVFYDPEKDVLWWQAKKYGGGGAARICCLVDASITTDVTFPDNYHCKKTNPTSDVTLCGTNGVFFPAYPHCWLRTPLSLGLTYQYTALTPSTGDTFDVMDWFFCDSFFHSVFSDRPPLESPNYIIVLRGRGLYRFQFVSGAVNSPMWNDPSHALPMSPVSSSAQYRVWQRADTDAGTASDQWCIVGADNVRTDDGGATFDQYEDFPGIVNNLIEMQAYDDGSAYYFVSATRANGTLELWFVNGQAGTGVQGDPLIGFGLSLFQGDLDTEPSGLYLGTEHRLLHFNLDSLVWDDLSPQYIESFPPDPGDDLTYKIDGDPDENRWVWRVTEKNGDKYIIATNGQIPPVAWKESLDEFRPVGDVDEDGVIDGGESSAPLATCMALANNRLILGKDLSIYISDPQDFDLGYSVEYKLADTYGSLVAMRELNALTIAILKTDAIYHGISQVEFMGVSAPMRFELIKAGVVGPCSDASVVYLPDGRLCWLGRDGGVYVYDGAVPVDVGRHIRHAISPILDTDRLGWAHACVDTKRNLLWVFVPVKAPAGYTYGMNLGLVMSIDQGPSWPAWFVQWPVEWEVMSAINVYTQTDRTYESFGESTYFDYQEVPYGAFEGGVWNFMILRKNLATYTLDWDVANDNGLPVHVLMETGWYDFDDNVAFDTFHEMHHLVEIQPGDELTWTLFSEQSDGSVRSQSSVLDSSTPRLRTSYRQTGRRHRFRMESDVANVFRWGGATGTYSRRGDR